MSRMVRVLDLGCVLLALVVLTGCGGSAVKPPSDGATPSGAVTASLAAATCWTASRLGDDPQLVLKISRKYDVGYPLVARALADRPAFARSLSCTENHSIEAYKQVRLPKLAPRLTDYAKLLQTRTPLYEQVDRRMGEECMPPTLAKAVKHAGVPGATMQPALPDWMELGWAPATPARWAKGSRAFFCTLSFSRPSSLRYARSLGKAFPTEARTCIDSRSLNFIDCARSHDRERIAVIDVSRAVTGGGFPGRSAIRTDSMGRRVDIGEDRYTRLDAACTAYLRTISSTKRLTGVAETDPDFWPAADGRYPVFCEAGVAPGKKSVFTRGTVYDR